MAYDAPQGSLGAASLGKPFSSQAATAKKNNRSAEDCFPSNSVAQQLPLHSLLLHIELLLYLHKQVKMGSVCHLFALLVFKVLTTIEAVAALEYKCTDSMSLLLLF